MASKRRIIGFVQIAVAILIILTIIFSYVPLRAYVKQEHYASALHAYVNMAKNYNITYTQKEQIAFAIPVASSIINAYFMILATDVIIFIISLALILQGLLNIKKEPSLKDNTSQKKTL